MELDPIRSMHALGCIIDEVTKTPGRNGNEVTLAVEINARPDSMDTTPAPDAQSRKNATQLGFDSHEFED